MRLFGPILNCVLCIITIICTLDWPETKDQPLQDNIETIDVIEKDDKDSCRDRARL